MNSVSQGSSPKIQERRARKRKAYSCTECRSRHKLCDRQVPGCSQCVSRGETHLCRWGDERDRDIPSPPSRRQRVEAREPANQSYCLVPSPGADPDESASLYDVLSHADAQKVDSASSFVHPRSHPSPAGRSIFSDGLAAPSSTTSEAISPNHSKKRPMITCCQARHLFYIHREQLGRQVIPIDDEAVLDAINSPENNDLEEIKKISFDLYALIIVICGSMLVILPPTYSITLGILTRSQDLSGLLEDLEQEAFSALDEMDMFSHPTIVGVQALAMYQLSLAHRNGGKLHIQRMDEFTRACRRLGLDRLGSVQDDERLWLEEDMNQSSNPSSLPITLSGHFAADTFRKREKDLRNVGRVLWSFAIAKDWVSSRLSGSCMIHPHSFNTSRPTPYSSGGRLTEDDATVWSFMWSASYSTLKYHDLCAEAQAVGKRVNYDQVLEMDSEMMLELDRRPDWLRPERGNEISSSTLSWEGVMVSCTYWHRLFALHRPFLALARSEPEKYGLSWSRSFEYATLTIRAMREGTQKGILMMKQMGMNYRLLQAALVVITHLFLGNDHISMAKQIDIHQDLHYAISVFKSLQVADSKGFFYGQGERLEVLLAASARIKNENMKQSSNNQVCSLRDRSQWKPFASQMQENTTSSYNSDLPSIFNADDIFSNLDDSFLKLAAVMPLESDGTNLNDVWNDIFSVLDTRFLPP